MAKNATHPSNPIHHQTDAAHHAKGSMWRAFAIWGVLASTIFIPATRVHGQDCNSNGVPDACDIAEAGACFDNPALWATFDAGANGVGNDPDGYRGAVFDGRYVYFVPHFNGAQEHGEVLRYDTTVSFSIASSWATFDPGANGVSNDPDGFYGAVSDGRYVYFVPHFNGTQFHGEVLRYDTAGSFSTASSWMTFDPGANGVGTSPDGFAGAVFDGRYVYFAPNVNSEVLRYDTTGDFSTTSSWVTFDPGTNGVGTNPHGFQGVAFDGQYTYFVPAYPFLGEVLRYDTVGDFSAASSWTTFDPVANGVGTDPEGFAGAVFDGRYVYFVPAYNGTNYHGEVLRYDTTGNFSTASSWMTFDPGANGVGTDPDGFAGAVFDGRYVYFVPDRNNTEPHGEVLRYDTARSFSTASAWATFDPGANGVGNDPDGFNYAVFDGRYVYFAPSRNGTEYHGEVLRYDTVPGSNDCNSNAIPDECDIEGMVSEDCNLNAIPDECDPDCNTNGIPDECDLTTGISQDCNLSGVPDECELTNCPAGQPACDDCNTNGILDECDIASGQSYDFNDDGQPDECYPDCQPNQFPDFLDIAFGVSADCNNDDVPDECEIRDGTSADCNLNMAPDECDIAAMVSADCNLNVIPDECEPDCNTNGSPDDCDVADSTSLDCNANGVPDECDVAILDCNANLVPDDCDIAGGASEDCNANAIPDECEPPLLSLAWAHSVAVHKVGGGQTQEFHVDLDITGDPLRRTSEPRNTGVRALECQFSQDVAAAEVRISGPTGLCAAGCPMTIAPGEPGPASLGRVDLAAPLPNAEVYALTITASTMSGCDLVHDLCVAALAGDFNSDGAVTSGDKGALLGFVFQPIAQANARYDLQVNGGDSGAIDVGDVGAWVGFFGNTVAGRDCP